MISEILAYTKKYFPCSVESTVYTIVSDGKEGSFTETYVVGQYISIYDSFLNDGVYKITAVSDSKLTLDTSLLAEVTDIFIYGLKLPKAYLNIINAIDTYVAANPTSKEIASESQGNRSVSYSTNGDNGSWVGVFKTQLKPYMSMFDDRQLFLGEYNIYTKRW